MFGYYGNVILLGDVFTSKERLDVTIYKVTMVTVENGTMILSPLEVGGPVLATRNGVLTHMILPHPLNNGQCGYRNPIG